MKKIIPFLFFVFVLSFNTSGQTIRGQAFTTNQYPGLRGRGSDGAVLLGSDAYVPTAKFEITGSNTLRAFVVNTNQMVITNGLTGLGTNNPIARLHVVATDRAIISTGIVHRFESGNIETFVITNSRVALSTNNPQENLHVANLAANSDPAIRISNDAQSWNLQTYGTGYDAFQIKDMTANKTPLKIQPGCADNTLVLTNGNVGIGIASLVDRPLTFTRSDGEKISLYSASSTARDYYGLAVGNDALLLQVPNTKDVQFQDGASGTNMVVKGSGNVGIGTTTPQQKLHVDGSVQLHNNIYHSTNAALGGAVVDMSRMCQVTNAGGNITWTGLSGTTPTNYCRSIVYVYADGADRSVTWPASWKNKDIATVYYVTNGWHAKIEIEVIGNSLTNVSYQLIR